MRFVKPGEDRDELTYEPFCAVDGEVITFGLRNVDTGCGISVFCIYSDGEGDRYWNLPDGSGLKLDKGKRIKMRGKR